jgi:hypothetical protein
MLRAPLPQASLKINASKLLTLAVHIPIILQLLRLQVKNMAQTIELSWRRVRTRSCKTLAKTKLEICSFTWYGVHFISRVFIKEEPGF